MYEYLRKCDGTNYLAFFSYVYSQKYMKININSGVDLPLEKTTNMDNVIILVKSAFIEIYSHYYHEMLLEKF